MISPQRVPTGLVVISHNSLKINSFSKNLALGGATIPGYFNGLTICLLGSITVQHNLSITTASYLKMYNILVANRPRCCA